MINDTKNPNLPSSRISAVLQEEFGGNASYVESLLESYTINPGLVDESWQSYFKGIVGGEGLPVVTPPESNSNGKSAMVTSLAGKPLTAKPLTAKPLTAKPLTGETVANSSVLAGAAKKIVENMELSLTVPTATSIRTIPVKLLEENRRLINQYQAEQSKAKVSFTHLIAWALLRALDSFPQLKDGYVLSAGVPARLKRECVNLGIAIDLERRDGTRTLLVPNIKRADQLTFSEFHSAYDDVIQRARKGKLDTTDFENTTISLTNPGTIGTVGSVPRLMSGQSLILATGAIDYPAEYQAMSQEVLSQLGVGKVVQVTSTYDHRIVQGAESGGMLAKMQDLLLGKENFYDTVFKDLGLPYKPLRWATDTNPGVFGGDQSRQQMIKEARVLELINSYRVRGHLIANIDPLHAMPLHYHPELEMETYGLTIWDLDRTFITGGLGGVESATLREILDLLHRSYCGTVGIEYRHIQSKEEKVWLRAILESAPKAVPTEVRKALLWKLISAEQFEQFLHKNFLGQKRFSVEGSETVIAVLDQLIEGAVKRGVHDVVLGMAHRGRINVLANVLGHFCERIFTAFEGSVHPNFPADEGDVKYHQGAKAVRETQGKTAQLTLSPNPSHLEFVDAVVEGIARAKQDDLSVVRDESWARVLPVLMHGDAAFAGQGIVMETLNLAQLKGYRTGGTIHIIVNNQIGFTTSPEAGRSTIYSTDVARMTQLPIFHINGDDPDAAYRCLEIALDYRQKFHKDVVLDLVGFRRLGHNESDEPSYTQPLMYARVKAHKGVRSIYVDRLVKEKVVTPEEAQALIEERNALYTDALQRAKAIVAAQIPMTELPAAINEEDGSTIVPSATTQDNVSEITKRVSIIPPDFHLNPKMVGQLAKRAKMGEGAINMDWAFAESLAFGSIVLDGTHVRLSGQDSGRGTFSQRHAVLYDIVTGQPWTPLSELRKENSSACFEVFDSSLSEQGVLGFEFGYSVESKRSLVLWEAQFGDFANGAQVIIDQFIAPSHEKWQEDTRLVLLLPHGYEGQGPEHSSARIERFLQLCGENNLQVVNPTTPAQYFHLLRRQIIQEFARPLVVMTPKSLLRLPAAGSAVSETMTGGFHPVLDEALLTKSECIRIVFCSGKLFYDLLDARSKSSNQRTAIVRLEQFYPFPAAALTELLRSYPNASEFVWAQEEPQNMGGWFFVKDRIGVLLGTSNKLRYAGRAFSASPATGFYAIHQLEQQQVVREALGAEEFKR
jgi:2-oxoglutarate decarboxylase